MTDKVKIIEKTMVKARINRRFWTADNLRNQSWIDFIIFSKFPSEIIIPDDTLKLQYFFVKLSCDSDKKDVLFK